MHLWIASHTDITISTKTRFGSDTDIIFQKHDKSDSKKSQPIVSAPYTTGLRKCWTWSGSRIAMQPDPDRTGFWKTSTRSEMDIQAALITAVKYSMKGIFRI